MSNNTIKRGMRVKTPFKITAIEGGVLELGAGISRLKRDSIEHRAPNKCGTVGEIDMANDFCWVNHDDGTTAAYEFSEISIDTSPTPAQKLRALRR